jgi:inositol oxygenase
MNNIYVGTADGPQWALGGDTWVVGCRLPECAVFSEFNELNPDQHHVIYGTELGIYEPHCGFENLHFAYGHDEYLYCMLVSDLFYFLFLFIILILLVGK